MPAQVNSNYSANFQKFVDFAVKDIRYIGSQTWPFPSGATGSDMVTTVNYHSSGSL